MTGKTALVFGGSRGIGRAIVEQLTLQDFDVVYTCTGLAPAPYLLHDKHVTPVRADISDVASVAAAFDAATSGKGELSCVVANAGINVPPAPVASFDPDLFRQLVEINIGGAFNVLQQAARQVADNGTIIAITTSLVRHAVPGVGPYAATKAAVECLIRSMAKELVPRAIRVNGVAPGPVDTDLFRAGKSDEALARSAAMSPFNRVGKPQEVAAVVGFLASGQSSWVHGQIIQPNGGLI